MRQDATPAARAFGQARADLDIDLADADRPGLISRLLLGALDGIDADQVWSWTVEERLQALIAIVRATCPAPPPWRTQCSEVACRAALEIALDPAGFAARPQAGPLSWQSADGVTVTARLPSGADQRAWRQAGVAEPAALARSLVEVIDGRPPGPDWQLPAAWLDGLAEAFAERDPLTVLQLVAACPSCGAASRIDFDLEGWLIDLLAAGQRRLLDEVHALAVAYHWGEAEICALPAWRRRAYLARAATP